jgi:serine/threonine-protein kinase HipA
MSERFLNIFINDRRVGQLAEQNNLWSFEYAQDWVNLPESFDLSPTLSRTQLLHQDGATNRPVQWYFDNLLPEENMRTILAGEAKLASEDAFGLLAYFGRESAGSLVLLMPEDLTPQEQGLAPLSFPELSERIVNLPHASISQNAPKKMSLAGAQHKLLVVLQSEALFEPLASTPSTHILKPNHPNPAYSASVMNEYFTMKLARTLGLDVPNVHRLYVPQPVYVVERFDRVISESHPTKRLHIVDSCQLLNKSREFKYYGANLDALALAINQCRNKAVARLAIYRWLVFNLLAGNGDNHLKNLSFLVDASGINIAKTYDLLSTAVYDTRTFANEKAAWPNTALALPVGNAKTFSAVTREDVLGAGITLGLSGQTAERELNRQLVAVLPVADELIEEIEGSFKKFELEYPDEASVATTLASERQVLRAIRHAILAEMVERLMG